MSLKFLRYFGRTLTFRLNLWYASIFTASAAVLFVLVYVLLYQPTHLSPLDL